MSAVVAAVVDPPRKSVLIRDNSAGPAPFGAPV